MEKISILKIRNLLIVTINNDLSDKSVIDFQQEILNRVYKDQARGVIIDISVLDIVDSFLGRIISDTAKMIKLLGAGTILVGMSPGVAITLIELGLDISNVESALDVESGIEMLDKYISHCGIEEVKESDIPGDE